MRSLQSYADTVSPRKRPKNSCSNCIFLAPQTSPESRIVWSLTAHRRRAPNSRPRADRENPAFVQRIAVNRVCSLNSIYEIANCFELHRTTTMDSNLNSYWTPALDNATTEKMRANVKSLKSWLLADRGPLEMPGLYQTKGRA